MLRSLYRAYLFMIVMGSFTSVAMAQATAQPEAAGKKYSLAELVALAMDNPFLGSQRAHIEEKRLAAAQARVWPAMSLDFLSGRKKDASGSGPRYEAALAQPLPLLGKPGLRGNLLDLETESWRIQRAASEIDIILNVVRLSYEYAANRRKAEFAEKRQKRFELIHEYLSGRVFPTPQGKAERNILRNRLKGLVSDAIHSQAEYKTSFEKLKVYAPLDSRTYPDIEIPWLAGAKSLDEKEWLARGLEKNPDLRLQRLQVKNAELQKSLARRDGLPDPSFLAAYEESKVSETEKNYGLGVSLAMPSWNSNRSGIRSAEQRRLAEEQLLGFEERKLKAEFPGALVEYEAARQTALKYPQALISELDAQLKEAEEGFRKGQVDLLTFLELDSSAAEAFGRVLDAQVELADRIAEIFTSTQEQDAVTQIRSY